MMAVNPQPERTLEQCRAADALRNIQSIASQEYGNYVSYVSSLPATIVMNGLGQALATLLASAGRKERPAQDPHRWLHDHVAGWLAAEIEELRNGNGPDAVLRKLMQEDQEVYVRAQAEALAYLQWLKQFARAYLKEAENNDD